MPELNASAWIWIIGLLAQSAAFGIVGTWWVSRVIEAIRDEIRGERKEVDQTIADIENQFRISLDKSERMIGETIAALRQKIHEVELWVRDNFVKGDSFYASTEDVKQAIEAVAVRLERRIDRLEKKVDENQN